MSLYSASKITERRPSGDLTYDLICVSYLKPPPLSLCKQNWSTQSDLGGTEHLEPMPGRLSDRPAFPVCLLFKSSTKLIRQLVLSQFVSLSLLFTHFLHNADVIVDIV